MKTWNMSAEEILQASNDPYTVYQPERTQSGRKRATKAALVEVFWYLKLRGFEFEYVTGSSLLAINNDDGFIVHFTYLEEKLKIVKRCEVVRINPSKPSSVGSLLLFYKRKEEEEILKT